MDKTIVKKLLKSSNKEDQIIGVNLAVQKLGEKWCRDNFNSVDRYSSRFKVLLKYPKFQIFLGTHYIEYWNTSSSNSISPERRFEGVDPIKEILEYEA